MSTLLDRLAEQLAIDAVEQSRRANDPGVIDAVAKSLADTSTTFKEAFLTCVRYIQADERAREILPDVGPSPAGLKLPPPKPQPAGKAEETAQAAEPVADPAPEAEPEDDGYAEVEYLDDDPPPPPQTESPRYRNKGRRSPSEATTRILEDDEAWAEAETPAVEPEITEPRKRGR